MQSCINDGGKDVRENCLLAKSGDMFTFIKGLYLYDKNEVFRGKFHYFCRMVDIRNGTVTVIKFKFTY